MRVLLVEDDYAVSQSIETMLKKEGIVFDNIGNGAVQDIAEYIQCLRGDGLAFLHTVDGIGGNTMLKDQFVFCYVLTKQSFKEWFV